MNEAGKETVKQALPLTVLYDGACPLWRREIGVYRGPQPLHPDSPVCFADVSDTAWALPSALPPGTTREQLLARFHVRGRDGALLSGAQAFHAAHGLRINAMAPGVADTPMTAGNEGGEAITRSCE